MPFQPRVYQTITVDSKTYSFLPNPIAKQIPYGQEAGKAIVYKVQDEKQNSYALKVFKRQYVTEEIVLNVQALSNFRALRGLRVCNRLVIAPTRHAELIQQFPDLKYAVIMPWISGRTWFELMHREALLPAQSLSMARAFADTLASYEMWQVAHCDISNGNVLFAFEPFDLQLVDVEDLYAPKLIKPKFLPGGSPGYAHHTAPTGLWSAEADRFAGAVLLAEILGWCDPNVRQMKYGEQFFNPKSMPQRDNRQPTSEQFSVLAGSLAQLWGRDVAELFSQAWYSASLDACPPLSRWAQVLASVALPSQMASSSFVTAVKQSEPPKVPVKIVPRQLDTDDKVPALQQPTTTVEPISRGVWIILAVVGLIILYFLTR